MATRVQLPDWLGGHAVRLVPGDWEPGITVVEFKDGPKAGERITVAFDWLLFIEPPSIDEPASLPFRVQDGYEDGLEIGARLDDETPIQIQRFHQDRDISTPVYVTVAQCRLIARALWQRANEIEGVAA